MPLNEKITKLRKGRGWTQEMLAAKMDVRKLQVSRWETGRMRPSGRTLQRLADLFGLSLDELLSEEDRPLSAAPGLAEKIRQLEQLDTQDRAMVYRLIDLLLMRHQMQNALATTDRAS